MNQPATYEILQQLDMDTLVEYHSSALLVTLKGLFKGLVENETDLAWVLITESSSTSYHVNTKIKLLISNLTY